jgi:2-haloacid dehalogenase
MANRPPLLRLCDEGHGRRWYGRLPCSGMAETLGAVVFDIGGVLLEWDPGLVYRTLIPDPEERQWFLSEVCNPEWNATLDAGESFDEACDALAARFPEHRALIHAWKRQDDMVAGEIAGTAEIVARLRAGGTPLYLLTNMPADVFASRCRRFPVLRQFDGAVVSGEEGVLKPSPEIFARLRDRFDLVPAETLFVDDVEINVVGARAAGFLAHRFVDPLDLTQALTKLGLAV